MSHPPRRLDAEDLPNSALEHRALRVFVDGERITNVVAFDVDEGFAIRMKLDDAGRVLVFGDEVVTETLRGIIDIEQGQLSSA